MYQYSSMEKKAYLQAMRRKFSNPLLIFDQRLTGFVIGPFFAAAHYQPHEWNRKITNECNRAWGFVKESHGELEITFLRGKGLLAPGWLVVMTLLCRLIFWIVETREQVSLGVTSWAFSAGLALVACAMTAVSDSLTDAGQAGVREMDKFLKDPENYYL